MYHIISRSNAPEGIIITQREDKNETKKILADFLRHQSGTLNKNKMSGFYVVNGIKIKLHIELRKKL